MYCTYTTQYSDLYCIAYVKFGFYEAVFIGLLREIGQCYGGCVVKFLNKFILYHVYLRIDPDPVTKTSTKVGQHSVTIQQ